MANRDIPLAPVVVEWFRELRALAGSSAYVLPAHSRSRAARHGGDTHLNKDTLREAIDHWLRTAKPAVQLHGRVGLAQGLCGADESKRSYPVAHVGKAQPRGNGG